MEIMLGAMRRDGHRNVAIGEIAGEGDDVGIDVGRRR